MAFDQELHMYTSKLAASQRELERLQTLHEKAIGIELTQLRSSTARIEGMVALQEQMIKFLSVLASSGNCEQQPNEQSSFC